MEYKTGDIFGEDVEALVNTVNCVDVTGRGMALQFKWTFPDNFRPYAACCKRKEMRPGQVVVFETGGGSLDLRANRLRNVPEMTAGRAALVGLVDCYLRGLLDPFVTLLEVHKLLYFMQAPGEPVKLKFAKGPYGPYAENLRHILNAMEGHLISGYADGGDAPDKQLELMPGALDDARAFLADKTTTQTRFERVSDLVEGFESSFGLELFATVHWIVGEGQARTFDDVVNSTYAGTRGKDSFPVANSGSRATSFPGSSGSGSSICPTLTHPETSECGCLERLIADTVTGKVNMREATTTAGG